MADSFILRKNNSNLKLKEMSYVICRNQGIIILVTLSVILEM